MELTIQQYNLAIDKCKDIFKKKTTDYGTAWRILRTSSLTDQIFIKANRIRTIQQTGESKINEGVEEEFVGIINYCVMALIQLELKDDSRLEIDAQEAIQLYLDFVNKAKDLMVQKNHDYGEAWRDMSIFSYRPYFNENFKS